MNFNRQLVFKDNKFRIQANSFYYSGNNGLIGGPPETFETGRSFIKDLNPKFDKAFLAFIENFVAAATSAKKSDW